jgi:hypothetical protein
MNERPILPPIRGHFDGSIPKDVRGITVSFHRSAIDLATFVTFRIPDAAQILSRDPEEFMRWCFQEMMKIASQARGMGGPL